MKKVFRTFFLLSRGGQIALCVFVTHLMVLLALAAHHLITSRYKVPRPMVVRTFSKQDSKQPLLVCKSNLTASSKPSKSSKTFVSQKSNPQKLNVSGALNKPVNERLLKNIEQSLKTIESEPQKKTYSNLDIPQRKSAPSRVFDEKQEERDAGYGELFIAFLQNNLDLPERLEVKMEIEIDPSGKLLECRILKSRSAKNAAFLRDSLASLNLPIPHLDRSENSKKLTVTFIPK